ncbi:YafY family protein [Kineosporia sp. R_H_3]|uniref:helix-turn-helix transcriptional regulator n=1 Tax=Kineosporia sp. R_H_3 TaxID=1961848 RepID=UPI000B4B6278|nr:WYL domain-containing protein [Kineosporia sp. R_H_3]
MSVGATTRLSRLLAMVPWLLQRQGVPLEEAAKHFGITADQLVKDLELLFVCGTPGHMPDDLIEADWESGRVYLDNAEAISRPLRLGVDEAVALLVGLRTLAQVPGLHDRDAVESALAKLSAAAGEAAGVADSLTVDLARGTQEVTLATVRDGLRLHRRLHLTYLVPSRDETTERDVDPMRIVSVAGRWYLEAWCHRAEGVRLFRLDRVVTVALLDVDGTPPPEAVSRDAGESLFTPSPDDLVVTLDLAPGSRWVAEYYPVEDVEEQPGGGLRVRLRTANPDWVPRLCLRLGGGARIVTPDDVADRLVATATAALALYDAAPA